MGPYTSTVCNISCCCCSYQWHKFAALGSSDPRSGQKKLCYHPCSTKFESWKAHSPCPNYNIWAMQQAFKGKCHEMIQSFWFNQKLWASKNYLGKFLDFAKTFPKFASPHLAKRGGPGVSLARIASPRCHKLRRHANFKICDGISS